MKNNWRDFIDRQTGELDFTGLAEKTANELGHPEWLDDSDHPLWDLSLEFDKMAPKALFRE